MSLECGLMPILGIYRSMVVLMCQHRTVSIIVKYIDLLTKERNCYVGDFLPGGLVGVV